MSQKQIFRKVALERLSSPEQLDQLMQVTDPKGWLALGALGALILAALVWSVLGTIPTEARGAGILIREQGVSNLVAVTDGQIEEILVRVGDAITEGQPVALLRQDLLDRQIQDTQARLDHQQGEHEQLEEYARKQRKLTNRNLDQERANLTSALETLNRRQRILQDRLDNERELLEEGLTTKQSVLDIEQELNTALDQAKTKRLEIAQLEPRRLEADEQLDQRLETSLAKIHDLEFELREQRAKLEENRQVVAKDSGRVLELMAGRGDVVSPGTPILSLEVDSEELIAELFIPASSGKQVKPGMEARVSPTNVKREEFGYIIGTVTWVSEYPATPAGMMQQLSNQALVDDLMKEGPPIQVHVKLKLDPSTPSGFAWSSSVGPGLPISSGTLATGSVIVRVDRPVRLLIPRVRDAVGF